MPNGANSIAFQSDVIPPSIAVFPTRLGWMALVGCAGAVRQLRFGFSSARAALAAVDPQLRLAGRHSIWNRPLVARLKRYAAGWPDGFADVVVDLGPQTPFQRRVIAACRAIPYGKVRTYGQLAAAAGSPRAARAVGRCMSSNPIPLIIPCHRVIASNGAWGGYSGGKGVMTKRALLEMEAIGRR